MTKTTRVTKLLQKVQEGSKEAYDELFPLIYKELKRIAYSKLKKERDDITLSETALVHEVYMKIVDQDSLAAESKSHFMAIAARCMREILIDHARAKKREKRGGSQRDITFIDELMEAHHQAEELIDIDAKLKELAQLNERLAKVVELRFFGKLPIYQVAQVLDVSKSTVKRDWDKARGWLYKELKEG
ncbi:ECF-type sigma factor [Fodinibius sp. AD559]|uniref:ECF-type sigma factor n=1 Tax=Fodinibius sp. AD559 TaxID=3424179 RepID=UPI004046C27D